MNLKAISLAIALSAVSVPAMATNLNVDMNNAGVVHIDGTVASVVVGNPMIADVTVLDGNMLVVHGRLFGTTNILIFNESGEALETLNVSVGAPDSRQVSLLRGTSQYTYVCPGNCVATFQPGDDSTYTDAIVTQSRSVQGLSDWALGRAAEESQ